MLSDAKARKLKSGDKPVLDGTVRGLYLFPTQTDGTGKWILRYVSPISGKRRDMGLGSYPTISLRDARTRAFEARGSIEAGQDPLDLRRDEEMRISKLASMPRFEEAARRLHADLVPGYRNAKHANQWIATLEQYIFPHIGKRLVNELGPADFAGCLKPIWLEKAETASRVKQRCESVMDWCAAQGFILASPVRVVEKLLPKQPSKRERTEHQPALPWRQVPALFSETLRAGPARTSKVVLELLILTACRSGEIRKMCWEEISFTDAVWTIPAKRMKAKTAHRIPLGPRAIEILEKQLETTDTGDGLVFPSSTNKPISDMTLTKFLRDKEIPSDSPDRFATAHGFRSSFKDWASENGYSRELSERALAHTVKSATEAAYHRTDLLEQRREMMLAWEGWCLSQIQDVAV